MQFVAGSIANARRVALLPGSFHPPTIAHEGLANAALERVDAVVFTLPRAFPHKSYEGVDLDGRLQLLIQLAASDDRFAVAVSDGGLSSRWPASFAESPFTSKRRSYSVAAMPPSES